MQKKIYMSVSFLDIAQKKRRKKNEVAIQYTYKKSDVLYKGVKKKHLLRTPQLEYLKFLIKRRYLHV